MIWFDETYAYINDVADKGKFSEVRLSTNRKEQDKDTKIYSNWSFVRFVGKAHERVQKHIAEYQVNGKVEKCGIKLLTGGFTQESWQDAQGQTQYPKAPKMVVFNFEFTSPQKSETKHDDEPAY